MLKKLRYNYWFKTPFYLILAFLLAIFVRVFLFEVYTIPSSSMEQTLVPGDKVFVSKLRYGPYLPSSLKEVPWLNVLYRSKNNNDNDSPKTGKRLHGYGSIQRNDVMVFEHPGSLKAYIKRCAGLPGDSLMLTGDTLFINGYRIQPAGSVQYEYLIEPANKKKLNLWAKENGKNIPANFSNGKMKATLTITEKYKLQNKAWIDSLLLLTRTRKGTYYASNNRVKDNFYSSGAHSGEKDDGFGRTGWKNFSFGPLYIPKKGATIRLNGKNLELYRQVIERHEEHTINQKNGEIYIDGQKRELYRFKQNYYFMLGDNRCHSSDSRSWGFVPESHIIGKAEFLLFSNWHGEVRWSRFFKVIS
jgi:signal peptidase I